jgi:hypothetical protein
MKYPHPHVPPDVMADVHNWITPESFHKEFPMLATLAAIHRDVRLRKTLGLDRVNAVRRIGRGFLVHRERYAAFRMGELTPPKR